MTTIRLGPDDGYPEGTRIDFSMEPTPIMIDSPDGETVTIVARSWCFSYCVDVPDLAKATG